MPQSPHNSLSVVKILNSPPGDDLLFIDDFAIETLSTTNAGFTLENEEMEVSFSTRNGLMRDVVTKRDNVKMEVCAEPRRSVRL